MTIRRFRRLRINRLRKFVSATTYYFHSYSHCHSHCPNFATPPPGKAKAKAPVTNLRPEPADDDEDLPPLEPEDTDRLHPSPVTGIPGSDSSDDLEPIPDSFTGFESKNKDIQEQAEEEPLEDDPENIPDDPDLFVKGDEEPPGEFEGLTVSGRIAPKPRSVHSDKVVQLAIGTEINTHWFEYITKFPRSDHAKTVRRKPEERTDEKIKREDVPILAETFKEISWHLGSPWHLVFLTLWLFLGFYVTMSRHLNMTAMWLRTTEIQYLCGSSWGSMS